MTGILYLLLSFVVNLKVKSIKQNGCGEGGWLTGVDRGMKSLSPLFSMNTAIGPRAFLCSRVKQAVHCLCDSGGQDGHRKEGKAHHLLHSRCCGHAAGLHPSVVTQSPQLFPPHLSHHIYASLLPLDNNDSAAVEKKASRLPVSSRRAANVMDRLSLGPRLQGGLAAQQ